MTTPRIGVVLVTRNSGDCLTATLESISAQALRPTRVLVVDDHSVDGTGKILDEWSASMGDLGVAVEVMMSTCTDSHAWTRIARNFTQGVLAMQDMDLVALGDHDDVWFPQRLELQSSLMLDEGAVLLASNGVIGDSSDTLFRAFDVPADFSDWNGRSKLRYVLRHSVATGGASMLRPLILTRLQSFIPPRGWLHDRWWSIVAAARGGFLVSDDLAIRYRLSANQAVGLDRGRQATDGVPRLLSMSRSDMGKLTALHHLKSEAAPELQAELSWGRLLKTLL